MLRPNLVWGACLLVSIACADELTWVMPTEDINGSYIDPNSLYATLYWGYSNSEWQSAGKVESPIVLDGVAAGCYYLRVTATRTDTSPEMESGPSNVAYYCTRTELPPLPPTNAGTD
jgi:hypothetical protein